MSLQIALANNQVHYRPGEWLQGWGSWNYSSVPRSIEFRLLWFTRGKGNQDLQIVQTASVSPGIAMGDAPFRFQLPDAPHSFSGTLISLVWAVEIVALPSQNGLRTEFFLSLTGYEIALPKIPQPLASGPFARPRS